MHEVDQDSLGCDIACKSRPQQLKSQPLHAEAGHDWDSPKASPTSPSFSVLFELVSSSPHTHSGYSLSSFASGASWPFVKPSPFKGVPAGTLLTTAGTCDFEDVLGGNPGVLEGEGEKGVEKG